MFISSSVAAGTHAVVSGTGCAAPVTRPGASPSTHGSSDPVVAETTPIVVSQWTHGIDANAVALRMLQAGRSALDAVEAGVSVSEADPNVPSVGYGGLPDARGIMTLDAAIMDHRGECGSVGAIEDIMHPIQVARKVMEETSHVMLVGRSATEFALAHGFHEEDLLTPEARRRYEAWKAGDPKERRKSLNRDHHDTIGTIAIDAMGRMAVACTTNGAPYKIPGRVGDSPIIGAGLYVDHEVGGATATGVGEEMIKVCGSFMVVENMRRGMSPNEAIEDVLRRVAKRRGGDVKPMVCFVALRRDGAYGGMSLSRSQGLTYAVAQGDKNELKKAPWLFDV